jgi:hypothetical protein
MRALLSPFGAFVVAAIVSVANPTFMTSGREAILMKIYERQRGGETSAYVKDGVLYRVNASGSMTANAKDGIVVDKNGGIWVIVPQKVYDGPYPVPVRKETEKFFREGLPMDVTDEIEGVGALFERR